MAVLGNMLVACLLLGMVELSDTELRLDCHKVQPLALRGGKEPKTKIQVRTDSDPALPAGDGWEPLPLGTFMVQTEQDSHRPRSMIDEKDLWAHGDANSTEACAEIPQENRTRYVRRLVDQARVFRHQGNLGVAEGNLDEALEISNFAAAPLCEMVSLKIQQGKLTDANELLFRGIERHPRLPELYSMRGDLFLRQGDVPAAQRSLEYALALDQNHVDSLSQLGSLLSSSASSSSSAADSKTRAASLLKKALELDPTHVPSLSSYGRHLEAEQEFQLAHECYAKAAQAQPNNVKALCNLGGCLAQSLGRVEEAKAVLRRALHLHPQHAPSMSNLALALLRPSNRTEPQLRYLTCQSGDGGDSQRERDEAESLLEQAVELMPEHVPSLSHYARCLADNRQYLPAQGVYMRAMELGYDGWSLEAYVEMLCEYATLVEDMKGDLKKAAAAYDLALRLLPSCTGACWRRAQLAWLLEEDTERAEALFKQGLASSPSDPETLTRYAMMISDDADDDLRAEQLLLRALEADPDHQLALQVYAELLQARGATQDAEGVYRRAVALNPALGKSDSDLTLSSLAKEGSSRVIV